MKNVDGVITQYLYDNEDILLEMDADGNVIARYTHGPGIDEPLIMERNGQSYYFITDGLGSVVKIVDASGNVVNNYEYDSFGNIVSKTESVENFYTYTGWEFDAESGLYYYRARYYDAKIRRFLNEDRIGFDGGINFYIYVSNNPINKIDPLGTFDMECALRTKNWLVQILDARSYPFTDDIQHCVAGCVLAYDCGVTEGCLGAIFKELNDLLTPGRNFEVRDWSNTLVGVWIGMHLCPEGNTTFFECENKCLASTLLTPPGQSPWQCPPTR